MNKVKLKIYIVIVFVSYDMDQRLNGDVSPIASDVRDKIMDYLSA